jgi:hypothetical protein
MQDEAPAGGEGALNFSDNAPSWEALQRLVEQQSEELGWQRPDLEAVGAPFLSPAA